VPVDSEAMRVSAARRGSVLASRMATHNLTVHTRVRRTQATGGIAGQYRRKRTLSLERLLASELLDDEYTVGSEHVLVLSDLHLRLERIASLSRRLFPRGRSLTVLLESLLRSTETNPDDLLVFWRRELFDRATMRARRDLRGQQPLACEL
jgi:hypothetical protein